MQDKFSVSKEKSFIPLADMICNKAESTPFDQVSCLTLLQHMQLFSVITTWSEAKSTAGIEYSLRSEEYELSQ